MVWENKKEKLNNRDDDRNGYIDDILGWNFVDKSARTFFEIPESTFHEDIPKYYELKAKRYTSGLTDDEKAFYNKLKKNAEFKQNRKIFSSYIHGTHIAGIATNRKNMPWEINTTAPPYKFLSIRYLGKNQQGNQTSPLFQPTKRGTDQEKMRHLNKFILNSKKWQTNKLEKAVLYVNKHVSVINGSFGRTLGKIKSTFVQAYKDQFNKEPSEEWATKTSDKFMKDIMDNVEDVAKKYPHILFVFSAGNKKADNDELPHYPSNAKASNIVAVGASNGYSEFASFSNFGKETVHLSAPGVAIMSTIPGDGHISSNGTSQAAPYVANVAIKAFALAKEKRYILSASQLKQILMDTVAKYDAFKGKSQSEGVIASSRVYDVIRRLSRGENYSRSVRLANRIAPESIEY